MGIEKDSRGPGATPTGHVWLPTHRESSWSLLYGYPLVGVPPLRVDPPPAPVRRAACVCIPRRRECLGITRTAVRPPVTLSTDIQLGRAELSSATGALSKSKIECDLPATAEFMLRPLRGSYASRPWIVVQHQAHAFPGIPPERQTALISHQRRNEPRHDDQRPVFATLPHESDDRLSAPAPRPRPDDRCRPQRCGARLRRRGSVGSRPA